MKWLDKWLYAKLRDMWDNKHKYEDIQIKHLKEHTINAITLNQVGQAMQHAIPGSGSRLDAYPDLSFQMFRAENGYVMQVRQHDRKTDRQSINLHVITKEQDLGTAIAHIITIESLKAS